VRPFVHETPTFYIFYVIGSQTGFENLTDTPNVSGVSSKMFEERIILWPTYFRIWEVPGSDIDPEEDYPH
jgi:hypothetical protein